MHPHHANGEAPRTGGSRPRVTPAPDDNRTAALLEGLAALARSLADTLEQAAGVPAPDTPPGPEALPPPSPAPAAPAPPPPGEPAAAASPLTPVEREVLRVFLTNGNQRRTMPQIRDEVEARLGRRVGEAVLKVLLARLTQVGLLENSKKVRPQGYRLARPWTQAGGGQTR